MNKFAVTSAGLGDGLAKSASTMNLANTSLEKTLAILTGASEITQETEEMGNAIKIGAMRVRGMKGALEELDEEVDDSVDSISKVQTQILNRTNGKVNIFGDNKEFRDYYDIMKDISDVWDELSQTQQADLSEILFGKNRGNQGSAIIQAFQSGQIQKAYKTVQESAGSAMQEQERWMKSLEAKTKQFDAQFQALSNHLISSDFLKGIVDFGTNFLSVLDGIIQRFGVLTPLLSGGALVAFVKNLD